jgi:ABC-type branched-subunit amino acid transport system ATPase component
MDPRGGVVLDVQSATVAFGGVRAVDDVSFRVGAQCLGIVGANGAGKTTLLNAISGLVSLRSGHVILDGSDLSRLGASHRAEHGMGRSFQHPLLMDSMTLEENLGGGRRVASSALSQTVWTFHLEKWMMRPVAELPYGIRKVADLARAAMLGTKVLLCDEPFSGLDETGREEVAAVLQGLRDQGRMLIVIEHDINRVSNLVDRFIVMDSGRKIFDGAPGAAMTDTTVQSALIGLVN